MKFLLDMNLSPGWVTLLSDADISATHWAQLGAQDASDRTIMKYAADHGYVVLTHDLDFGAILAATRGKKPSVVQIRSDNLQPEVIGPVVLAALRKAETELTAGALVSVEPYRTRLRMLPLPDRET